MHVEVALGSERAVQVFYVFNLHFIPENCSRFPFFRLTITMIIPAVLRKTLGLIIQFHNATTNTFDSKACMMKL